MVLEDDAMKRTKRKYTRHVKPIEPIPDNVQSISSPIKEESSTVDRVTGEVTEVKPDSRFSFNDLPLSIRMQVERIIKMHKRLGLPDDSKERKERAVRYFRGGRPR